MSLNSPEIDAILDELELAGQHIQKVIQPDFRNLYLQLFRPPGAWWLRICLEHPWVRLHRTDRPPRAKRSHQRFEDFLWSRLKGGRVRDVEHVFQDRIVRLTVERDGQTTLVYTRLWGTRANIIVTEADGTILDAFFRKPGQGIESGARFVPEAPTGSGSPRTVRERVPGTDFNAQIETAYREQEIARDHERLESRCRKLLEKELRRAESRIRELEAGRSQKESVDDYRHWGDLILANAHRVSAGADHVEVEDYLDGNRLVRITLDPTMSASGNAQTYYDRARRAEESAGHLDASAAALHARRTALADQLSRLADMELADLRVLAGELEQRRATGREASQTVGLEFSSGGFRILVGRNARENDELLRRASRGNDWWLHTRDVTGGYVFIRAQKGKSIPLDVLLDAGNLAVFFSKARSAGRADLYYTQVKYLRRAKDGPRGLVLPTQEKNLLVDLDPDRLRRLGIGGSLDA